MLRCQVCSASPPKRRGSTPRPFPRGDLVSLSTLLTLLAALVEGSHNGARQHEATQCNALQPNPTQHSTAQH